MLLALEFFKGFDKELLEFLPEVGYGLGEEGGLGCCLPVVVECVV